MVQLKATLAGALVLILFLGAPTGIQAQGTSSAPPTSVLVAEIIDADGVVQLAYGLIGAQIPSPATADLAYSLVEPASLGVVITPATSDVPTAVFRRDLVGEGIWSIDLTEFGNQPIFVDLMTNGPDAVTVGRTFLDLGSTAPRGLAVDCHEPAESVSVVNDIAIVGAVSCFDVANLLGNSDPTSTLRDALVNHKAAAAEVDVEPVIALICDTAGMITTVDFVDCEETLNSVVAAVQELIVLECDPLEDVADCVDTTLVDEVTEIVDAQCESVNLPLVLPISRSSTRAALLSACVDLATAVVDEILAASRLDCALASTDNPLGCYPEVQELINDLPTIDELLNDVWENPLLHLPSQLLYQYSGTVGETVALPATLVNSGVMTASETAAGAIAMVPSTADLAAIALPPEDMTFSSITSAGRWSIVIPTEGLSTLPTTTAEDTGFAGFGLLALELPDGGGEISQVIDYDEGAISYDDQPLTRKPPTQAQINDARFRCIAGGTATIALIALASVPPPDPLDPYLIAGAETAFEEAVSGCSSWYTMSHDSGFLQCIGDPLPSVTWGGAMGNLYENEIARLGNVLGVTSGGNGDGTHKQYYGDVDEEGFLYNGPDYEAGVEACKASLEQARAAAQADARSLMSTTSGLTSGFASIDAILELGAVDAPLQTIYELGDGLFLDQTGTVLLVGCETAVCQLEVGLQVSSCGQQILTAPKQGEVNFKFAGAAPDIGCFSIVLTVNGGSTSVPLPLARLNMVASGPAVAA